MMMKTVMLTGDYMQKDLPVLFSKYNKIANEKMDAIIKGLTTEEWNRDLGGYFKSVRGLCSHLFVCDFNWLKRFSVLREFSVMKQPFMGREPFSFSAILFEDTNEYLSERVLMDEYIISFVNELEDGDFNAMLKYTDSSGTVYEKNFGGLVMHSFNHATHHRGMLSLYLEFLGRPNDFNSFNVVL